MNERIKELMAQAGFDPAAIERMGVMPQAEKFAKLVVQECVDVLVDVLPSVVPEAKDGVHPVWHIKEHFGVA